MSKLSSGFCDFIRELKDAIAMEPELAFGFAITIISVGLALFLLGKGIDSIYQAIGHIRHHT